MILLQGTLSRGTVTWT